MYQLKLSHVSLKNLTKAYSSFFETAEAEDTYDSLLLDIGFSKHK